MRTPFFLFIISALTLAGCGSADKPGTVIPAGAGKTTTIEWTESSRDFGKINEGQKLAVSFPFRNSGPNPLVIESVQPSCGCTVASFPRQPVAPGAESQITGEFDSHGREGHQHKVLTVKANTPGNGQQEISFDVDVVKKAATDNGSAK